MTSTNTAGSPAEPSAYAPPAPAPTAPPVPGESGAPTASRAEAPGARGWRSIAMLVACAAITIAAADLFAWRLAPPIHRREVQDGVAALRAGDPDVLVLGSSHARTFVAVGDELARRSEGRLSLVAVPVEAGKLATYAWVLDHRLRPLVEERRADGSLVRPRLSRFVLLTEWWDSCPVTDGTPGTNLPSRAWTFRDFAADVWRNGITDYNRNYLQTRWSRLFWESALVQDRGQQRIPMAIRTALGITDPAREARRVEARIAEWHGMVEGGTACIGDARQMAGLEHLLAWAKGRGLDATVVLFPRKPATITEKAKATTLARFREMADATTRQYGARLVDYTTSTPLRDDEFMADFDHVTLDGNRRFARWALDRELGFLLAPATPQSTRVAQDTKMTHAAEGAR